MVTKIINVLRFNNILNVFSNMEVVLNKNFKTDVANSGLSLIDYLINKYEDDINSLLVKYNGVDSALCTCINCTNNNLKEFINFNK